MTRLAFFVCLILLGANSLALAQSKRVVRAGDQSTYSRLVVPVTDEEVWELRTSGRRAIFSIDGTGGGFEVAQVRDRVSRTRLLSIRDTGRGGLEMSLGCDCSVVANIESGSVVIDIVDPGREPPILTSAKTAPSEDADEQSSSDQSTFAEADLGSAPDLPFVTRPKPPSRPREEAGSSGVAPNANQDQMPQSDVVKQLIRQLEAAAEQGIVEMAPEDMPDTRDKPVIAANELEDPELQPVERGLDGLDALTSRVEEGLGALADLPDSVRITVPGAGAVPENQTTDAKSTKPNEQKGANCIPPNHLDFAAWTRNAPFSDQIQDLRTILYDDVDNVDATILRDLIRIYVLLGFGVEAQALLTDEAVEFEGRAILAELAVIAEGGDLPPQGSLVKAMGCDGRNALWRTIGIDKHETQPVENVDDLLVEFSNLPVQVRRHYGPRLIRSFLHRKQLDAATAVFAIIDRAVGPHGDAHELIRARLLEIEGNTEAAEAILVDLFTANGELAPEALLRLAELYSEEGRDIPAEMIADLEAEAYRYRADPIGTSLRLAEIRAKAGSKQFGAALDVIASELGQNEETDGDYLRAANTILSEVDSESVGAVKYTTAIFAHEAILGHEEVTADTRLHVGGQLLDLGLPSPAIEFANESLVAGDPQAKLIVAQAYLDIDNPEGALSVLDENDPSHAKLRSMALQALGQFSDALAAQKLAGATADTLAAWRAGDWRTAKSSEDEDLSRLAAFMEARMPEEPPSPDDARAVSSGLEIAGSVPSEPLEEEELSLAEANQMAAEAADARSRISSLLERY